VHRASCPPPHFARTLGGHVGLFPTGSVVPSLNGIADTTCSSMLQQCPDLPAEFPCNVDLQRVQRMIAQLRSYTGVCQSSRGSSVPRYGTSGPSVPPLRDVSTALPL
jgi:hypothetical protein